MYTVQVYVIAVTIIWVVMKAGMRKWNKEQSESEDRSTVTYSLLVPGAHKRRGRVTLNQ